VPARKRHDTEIARAFAASVRNRFVDRTVASARQLATKGTVPVAVAQHIAGVAGLLTVVQPRRNVLSHQFTHRDRSTCPEDGGGPRRRRPNGGYTPFPVRPLYGLASFGRAT